jgi:uracil permease
MIASIGIRNMVDAQVDLSDPKPLIISSTMLVLGLGGATFEFGNFAFAGLGLAAIIGIILNLIIRSSDIKNA